MVSLGSRLASCSVLALGLLACRATPAGSGTEPASVRSRNEHPRSVHLIDLYGRRVAPLASAGRPVVCVFVATACRGSAHYASEVRRLAAEFGAGFDFWVIYADPGDDFNEVRRHAREQDYGGRAARDPLQALAGLAGIVTTPAAAVFERGRHAPLFRSHRRRRNRSRPPVGTSRPFAISSACCSSSSAEPPRASKPACQSEREPRAGPCRHPADRQGRCWPPDQAARVISQRLTSCSRAISVGTQR